jgi:bacillithiol biosynthesis cysteine-adding enzyme BshC
MGDSVDVITEPLGGGVLARLALSGSAPPGLYAATPHGAPAWRARADEVRRDFPTAAWLDTLAPAVQASGPAARRLARAAREGGVLVTTGQQPGLFGGPIYTWSKALSALALADAIEEATGIPTAPVFWAATDDTDFAEASWTTVAVPGGAETIHLPPPGPENVPMSEVPLGDVSHLIAHLERGAGAAAYAPALDATRRAYRAGQTVGSANVELLRTILEPLGIAVLDASHPATRAAAAAYLQRALGHSAEIERALIARRGEIEACGADPQVAVVEGLSLVFVKDGAGKRRLRNDEAAAFARAPNDRELSPNVLLRPVIERAILPTVAYVAGPGEISYFAQVSAVAAALEMPAPLALPRWSGTIIEPHIARILARYDLAPEDLRELNTAETRLAAAAVPTWIGETLADLRASVESVAGRLAGPPDGRDALVPPEVVEGARNQLLHRVERLQRRYVAAAKRREATALADLGTARGALYPGGKRQERALNFIPLLARHGPDLLEQMRARASERMSTVAGLERAGSTAASLTPSV